MWGGGKNGRDLEKDHRLWYCWLKDAGPNPKKGESEEKGRRK